jgi:hypothetical protein
MLVTIQFHFFISCMIGSTDLHPSLAPHFKAFGYFGSIFRSVQILVLHKAILQM